jgi:FemAB-related protein (PEP-CTERM system-associated)
MASGTGPRSPATKSSLAVQLWQDQPSWDRFVANARDGGLGHRWAWMQVVPAVYGHRVFPLAATAQGRLVGVLPLVLVRSVLFGRVLVSMPYLDSGGVCSDGDLEAEAALLAAGLELADQHRVRLELRQDRQRDHQLTASCHKVTMEVDLTGGAEAVWARVRSNKRGQVRKAERAGLTATRCGGAGTTDFYQVLAANMRDLGSPVHRRGFFDAIHTVFGPDAITLLVQQEGRTVGSGLLLLHGGRATLPWSSSLRSALHLAPNQLLYWEAVQCAADHGCQVLDLGRSSPGSGTHQAKREWGAIDHPLFWYRSGPVVAPDAPDAVVVRLAWATRLWTRVPLPLATGAGALIRGGLPQ